ncbi:MAG: DUF616 domain-containing protein [Oscillospiraceae bacterium]|jgi:hypothetical protein|nr:DUF616 domain-containing protein [Oscillospiraceae bacterium]
MAQNTKVCYSCVTGGYDTIKDPCYITPGWDYIMFTDDQELHSDVWDVRVIDKAAWGALGAVHMDEPRLMSKFIKLCPTLVLPEYTESLWVDATIYIWGDLDEYIHTYSRGADMLCFIHPDRCCAYDEAEECINLGKVQYPEAVTVQMAAYRAEGFPVKYGLISSCILYRKHTDRITDLGDMWYAENTTKCSRDQVSFTYCCWKLGIAYDICYYSIFNNPFIIYSGVHYNGDSLAGYEPVYWKAPAVQSLKITLKSIIYQLLHLKPGCLQRIKDVWQYYRCSNSQSARLADELKKLARQYEQMLGVTPNLKHPRTFNEKLNWLKVYNRRPEYTRMADKLEARKFVEERFAGRTDKPKLVPLLGVWDRPEDIDFSKLPESFVLKCNHDSGSTVLVRDKRQLNLWETIRKLKLCLWEDFSQRFGEWAYRHIKRKVFAEAFLGEQKEMSDFRFFCFDGKPEYIILNFNHNSNGDEKFTDFKRNVYDIAWSFQTELFDDHQNDSCYMTEAPMQLSQMLEYATILSENVPFLRVDFNIVKDEIYFGELTFYPAGAYGKLHEIWDKRLGSLIKLPPKTYMD